MYHRRKSIVAKHAVELLRSAFSDVHPDPTKSMKQKQDRIWQPRSLALHISSEGILRGNNRNRCAKAQFSMHAPAKKILMVKNVILLMDRISTQGSQLHAYGIRGFAFCEILSMLISFLKTARGLSLIWPNRQSAAAFCGRQTTNRAWQLYYGGQQAANERPSSRSISGSIKAVAWRTPRINR